MRLLPDTSVKAVRVPSAPRVPREPKGPTDPHKYDHRKTSVYFDDGVLDAIKAEAERLDRSVSWVLGEAWRLAKDDIGAQSK